VSAVNTTAKNHNRTVYSSQAIRAVAEQIDALYFASAPRESQGARTGTEGGTPQKGSDLTIDTNIDLLPEEWASTEDGLTTGCQEEEYRQLRQRLAGLDEQRNKCQERLSRYKHLQMLVGPLKDPRTNVQPNLVTRDGELASELERTRVLLARVISRAGNGGYKGEGEESMDLDAPPALTGKEKLKTILDGP
jgi:hypothetical protein